MAAKRGLSYTPEARRERAIERANEIDAFIDIRGKRVLEIGCGMGDLAAVLAQDYACEVVGMDIMRHDAWADYENVAKLTFLKGDISQGNLGFSDNSFDRIISIVTWEHMLHPWSALKYCQQLLRPDGKKYIHCWLYGTAHASHLYNVTEDVWPHLIYSPREVSERYGLNPLPWYYWCNRLSYQHYLFYFRQLGFHVTREVVWKADTPLLEDEYSRKILDLYPNYDLTTQGFKVVLEFDPAHPKQSIPDPVYRLSQQ